MNLSPIRSLDAGWPCNELEIANLISVTLTN